MLVTIRDVMAGAGKLTTPRQPIRIGTLDKVTSDPGNLDRDLIDSPKRLKKTRKTSIKAGLVRKVVEDTPLHNPFKRPSIIKPAAKMALLPFPGSGTVGLAYGIGRRHQWAGSPAGKMRIGYEKGVDAADKMARKGAVKIGKWYVKRKIKQGARKLANGISEIAQ